MFSRRTDVVDVNVVREVVRRPWFKSHRLWILLAVMVAAISAASWWTYAVYLKPSRDQRRVDEAEVIVQANSSMSNWSKESANWPNDRKLITLSSLFRRADLGVPAELGVKASRSALDLAINNGSRVARLELGKALRDGAFGDRDSKAAVIQFQIVLDEIQPGLKAGDEDSLYVYSLMLKEGLAVDSDTKKAREIVKRVALSRDYMTMKQIGSSVLFRDKEDRDLELAKAISLKLIATGHADQYILGAMACVLEFKAPDDEVLQFRSVIEAKDWNGLGDLNRRAKARRNKETICQLQFMRPAAEKSDKFAIEYLAENAPEGSPLATRDRSLPTLNTQPADPEAQSRTGYLNGTKQSAKGGLSTFRVDNTRGGGDAVARLYLDGKKPAARSMFVKNGESFLAQAISPGAYRLRYRYMGSVDTFEAEETFVLSETPSENGTRFSRVTVTLYKVANGNMTVKKVDESEF